MPAMANMLLPELWRSADCLSWSTNSVRLAFGEARAAYGCHLRFATPLRLTQPMSLDMSVHVSSEDCSRQTILLTTSAVFNLPVGDQDEGVWFEWDCKEKRLGRRAVLGTSSTKGACVRWSPTSSLRFSLTDDFASFGDDCGEVISYAPQHGHAS